MRAAALFLCTMALFGQAPVSPAERLAETALAFAQAEAAKLGGEHSFKVAQPPRVPMVQPGELVFEATHISKREPLGRFFVVVAYKVNGERVGVTRVDLEGKWVGTVLRAKGDLTRQTELTAEQVEPSPFEGVPPEGALTEVPEGQRLMRSVVSGKILTRADLEAIPLIQSGDKVRLTATHEALTVTVETTARSRAGLNDRVRLEAPGARRQVTGIVTGPGEARLQ
ncbi:flagellar basal body P-ring formation chaperone FlgA [Geothrix sp. PMB-07]|uniref:flagellar basal body P-ring formation chaperone FlgA n=1 Tax=Geothrix sp. PMB-07 TaxID=3068640 RepID=UPI0027413BC9|nr:flagellar basal body P-ring formation chaperone FlgA [Geothrix sp. PMB-07]WLT32956.1 flagellar basal body P-ring formation chaperone FlgA [Geothrix sp. PMB-07]